MNSDFSKNTHLTGVVYVLGFVLLANANAVFSGRLLQSLHPFVFLFWAFIITVSFYATTQFLLNGRSAFSVTRDSLWPLIALNMTSAFNWIGYFFALRYLEPAIVAAIMCGFGPVSVVVLEKMIQRNSLSRYAYVAAIGTIVGATFLVWTSFIGLAGIRSNSTIDVIIGLCAALAGGISQALTTIVIKELGRRSWTASKIMVHRFYLLLLVVSVLTAFGPGISISSGTQFNMFLIAVVLGVITPLFLLQRGILLSDPFTTSVLLALGPVLTYLFQLFDDRIEFSITSAIGCFVVVFFVVYGTWMKTRTTPRSIKM
jgi:drug/metabolite transporter (DMT)-like permease